MTSAQTPPGEHRTPLRMTFLATVLAPRFGLETARGVTVTLDRRTPARARGALRRRLGAAGTDEILAVTRVCAGAQLLLAAPRRFRAAVVWEPSITPRRLRTGRRFPLRAEAVVRGGYRRAAVVVCVSPVVADVLRDRWAVGSVLIPNLLDLLGRSPGHTRHLSTARAPDRRAPGTTRPARLLALGEARSVKNYDVLLQACALLDLDWRLTVAGGGPQEAELRALATSLAIDDRVDWPGFVADPAPLLAGSDLLVHPSSAETFGYVLLEAAEQWLPVVTTDAPVMDALVPRLVPGVLSPGEPRSLAAAVTTALAGLTGPGSTPRFVAADERRREGFGRDRVLAAWEEVLHG